MKKSLAVAVTAALALSVFAALPADAKKKKKKPKPCATFVPGELGADAGDAVVVTDAATEEAPVVVEAEAAPGLILIPDSPADLGASSYYNIQVDSKAKSENLYVRLEWSGAPWDYDLYVRNPDGTELANAHGFNPAPDSDFSPESDGGHTETNAEQVDGASVTDCQGFTVDVSSAGAPGGAVTLKYWLGDPPA